MHSCKRYLVVIAAVARLCGAAGTMQLPWTTDLDDDFPAASFGPDGPWQAVAVFVGDDDSDGQKYGVPLALWPSTSDISWIPTVEASGNYSVNDSSPTTEQESWRGGALHGFSYYGRSYFDSITFPEKGDGIPTKTNGSIVAADESYQELPNSPNLNQSVGKLGLGPNLNHAERQEEEHPSLLEQLKKDGKIGSASYSVHFGSVEFDQPGSLVLGGYEQNRVIGQTGVFSQPYDNPIMQGTSLMFLLDVVIGVETGGSPFDSDGPISVYAGLDDKTLQNNYTEIYSQLDVPRGSALITPNPAVPYIYLPPDTCEKVAKQLPVTYYRNIGFYLWDTSDPQFARIVTSPTYLGFILSDITGANITIKVPFRLLNLTLTPPLVNEPTAYFPCMNDDMGYGIWSLGRAFLQAAFLATNFDTNHTYLAQAPGPGMSGSMIREMNEDDPVPVGGGDSLEASWREHWTVLPGGEDAGGAGLSAGAIAGIVVGVVVILGVILAVVFWRRKRARKTMGEDDEKPPTRGLWGSSWWKGAEAQGTPVHEMEVPDALHEAPGGPVAHEMAAKSVPVEMPASPVK